MFRRTGISLGILTAVVLSAAAADELAVAKEALRDGLWEVARVHAQKADGPESRVIVAESFAREGKWKALLAALEEWKNPDTDVLVYYRALGLVETEQNAKAGYILNGRKFTDPVFACLAARLRARVALSESGAAEALKIVSEEGEGVFADEESKMYAASLMAATGDRIGAEKLWTEVVADTNASERAFAVASVNLKNVKLVRQAFARAKTAEMRRLAGFGLGKTLIADASTFDEGMQLIRTLSREAPDAEGARAAVTALADACYTHGRFKDAADVYREAFETWPDAVKSVPLNDGYGWTLEKLGRYEEALAVFVRAENAATDDAVRAVEIVKQGDVLSAAGKTDEALEKYRSVLARFPASESATRIKNLVRLRERENEGLRLYRGYRFAEAQAVFREIGAEDPSRKSRMDYFDVMCLYGQGLDDEAEKKIKALIATVAETPIRADATLWLAKFSYNRGKWSESRKLFTAYAELVPESPEAPEALVWSARAAFAENDFKLAIQTVTRLAEKYPDSPSRGRGFLVQGESLIELARFDEAVLVLERVALAADTQAADRLRAKILGADALFAMGADNTVRYEEALEAYRGVRVGESLDPSVRLSLSYKIAKTLEKLKRTDEAIDRYYADVVLAYREGRTKGVKFDDEARASFSRAAFRLADEFESRGKDFQAIHILELVAASDVPAAAEATKRIARIQRKGNFL